MQQRELPAPKWAAEKSTKKETSSHETTFDIQGHMMRVTVQAGRIRRLFQLSVQSSICCVHRRKKSNDDHRASCCGVKFSCPAPSDSKQRAFVHWKRRAMSTSRFGYRGRRSVMEKSQRQKGSMTEKRNSISTVQSRVKRAWRSRVKRAFLQKGSAS